MNDSNRERDSPSNSSRFLAKCSGISFSRFILGFLGGDKVHSSVKFVSRVRLPLTPSPSPIGRGWPKRRRSRRTGEGSVANRTALLGGLRLLATTRSEVRLIPMLLFRQYGELFRMAALTGGSTAFLFCLVFASSLLALMPQAAFAQKTPRASKQFEDLARRAAAAREADRYDQAVDLYKKALEIKPRWEEGG